MRESNEQCKNGRWKNVCLQTILPDYILIGRMPVTIRYYVSLEMRSIFEVGTRKCAIDDIIHSAFAGVMYKYLGITQTKRESRCGSLSFMSLYVRLCNISFVVDFVD